jgi:uncharacterized protein YidB (DUF937 family)
MGLLNSLLGTGNTTETEQSIPAVLISLFGDQGSGGLQAIVQRFETAGLGAHVASWIGGGENKQIAPDDVAQALGEEQISALASKTGMNTQDLLAQLSQHLPEVVDQLTPNGQIPTGNELLAAGMNFLKSRM